jgi:hypothetical protein
MTMTRARHITLLSLCACVAACGTKFIDNNEQQQLGGSSSDDGGTDDSATATAGMTGQGEAESGGDSGGDDGTTGCVGEVDPSLVCGPEPVPQAVTLAGVPPDWTEGFTGHAEYDCTIVDLSYADGIASVMVDCGLGDPQDWGGFLPQATFDKLAVDQAVHLAYNTATIGGSAILSIDDHPVIIRLSSNTLDPVPGSAALGPFTAALDDESCDPAPCGQVDGACFGAVRQSIDFSADGIDTVQVWDQGSTVVTLDGADYEIAVGVAIGAVVIDPDSPACVDGAVVDYALHIVDITAP